jgi:hypothetical protein
MMGGNTSKRMSNEEMDQHIRFLVGEEFISRINDSASEITGKFYFEKLYAQLEAIILLSSMQTENTESKGTEPEQENFDLRSSNSSSKPSSRKTSRSTPKDAPRKSLVSTTK